MGEHQTYNKENQMATRKASKTTRTVKQRPVHFAPKHDFLQQRGLTEAYIVQRIDDFNEQADKYGAFWPEVYGQKGGCLWPNHDSALQAANVMMRRNPECKYGIFKLFTIVETQETPIKVTKV